MDFALYYSGLGKTSKALDHLLRAGVSRAPPDYLVLFNVEPAFVNLRLEPRFKSLLKTMNLP